MRLPLYETPPQAEAAWDEPLRRDPGCARCKLSEAKPRTVCMKPEGQPGGLLVLVDGPGKVEDATGRPLSGPTGKWLRERLARHWKGPIAFDSAVRCFPNGEEVDEKHADACRPYTAKLLADVRPTRILTMGTWATYGFLGRKVPALVARRAYGWWIDGEAYPVPASWVPVFALPNPVNAMRNKFYARTMAADLKWALTCERPSTDFVRAEVTYVRDEDTAQGAYLALSQAPWVSFDTETAGLLFDSDFEVVCVTFYGGDDLQHGWAFDQESWKVPGVLAWARKVLAHAVPKTGHNTKYDSHAVYLDPALRTDIERSWWGDTRLFRKLLDGDVDARLAVAAELVGMGGHKAEAIAAEAPIKADLSRMASQVHGPGLTPKGKPRKAYVPKVLRPEQVSRTALENIHAERAEPMTYVFKYMEPRTRARYNARDALSTAYLQAELGPRVMAQPNLKWAWDEIMLPASKAFARMERRGVGVSRDAIESFAAYLDAELEPVSAVLAHYPEVNWNSPVQVAKLLFGKLGLPSVKETDSGADSTDAEVLEALKDKHPVVRALLRHRKLTKLQGTYARGMLANIRGDGRVHSSFLIDGASSGRASSQSPNLQNIPSGSRDPVLGKMARDCFVAPAGRSIVELDYSQIELRVAAYISRDPKMIAMFNDPKMDFHLATAKMVAPIAWGVKGEGAWDALPPELKKKYRTDSKVVNFGVHYGKTAPGLADELGISVAVAERLLNAILGEFNVLRAEMARTVKQGHADGGVMVCHQGKPANWRPLPALGEMGDDAKGRRMNAERALWNSRVQGEASHLMAASLWPVTLALEARPELQAFPVLTVHDSLMVECVQGAEEETARIMRQVMTRYDLGGVPIVVDAAAGAAWGSLEELKLDGV